MSASRSLPSCGLCLLLGLRGCAPAGQGTPAGTVVLMGTTDVHGWLLPHDYYTGERTGTPMAVRVTGRELRDYLEKSAEYYHACPQRACERVTDPAVPGYDFDIVLGVEYTLDLSRPIGERVTRLQREGRPVGDDQIFTLALNNYRQGGGGGFPGVSGAEVVYDAGESIRDLLIAEVEERGVISLEEYHEPNWEILPRALAERALREQTR